MTRCLLLPRIKCQHCGRMVPVGRPDDADEDAWEELSWEHDPNCWWVLHNGPIPPAFTHAQIDGGKPYRIATEPKP